MPNWCRNILTVKGSEEQLQLFREKAVDGDRPLSFNNFVPMPADLDIVSKHWGPDESRLSAEDLAEKRDLQARYAANTEKYGYATWYDWAPVHWGTKWDASNDTFVEDSPGRIVYDFDTAWAPPAPVVEAMAIAFPQLEFHLSFSEPGMGFAGTLRYVNGECVEETTREYSYDDDYKES